MPVMYTVIALVSLAFMAVPVLATHAPDVWTEQIAAAQWPARSGMQAAVLTDGSVIVVAGKESSQTLKHDVWRTADNGETWTVAGASDPFIFVVLGSFLVMLCTGWLLWSIILGISKLVSHAKHLRDGSTLIRSVKAMDVHLRDALAYPLHANPLHTATRHANPLHAKAAAGMSSSRAGLPLHSNPMLAGSAPQGNPLFKHASKARAKAQDEVQSSWQPGLAAAAAPRSTRKKFKARRGRPAMDTVQEQL